MTRALHDTSSSTGPVARGGPPLIGWSRLPIVGASVMFAAALALAAQLSPDPQGLGTHRQLGFPPCTILTIFKFPCPTCGMTTSFAHFVRGEWIDAARVNASGMILACFGTLFLPWAAVSLTRKEYWLIAQPGLWMGSLLVGWTFLCVLEWSVRHLLPRIMAF